MNEDGGVKCEVGGIVLAAGLSERMDGPIPKQLLPLGHTTVAATVVRTAEASRLDRVVVVTGHRAVPVAASVGGGRAQIVNNPEYRDGNLSSFRVGAAALAGCKAFVLLLADMPEVATETIDHLVDLWVRERPWAARSMYRGEPGHPLLLSADAVQQAIETETPRGVWRLLAGAPAGAVLDVTFDSPVPADINTRTDYEQVLDQFSAGSCD